MLTFIRRTLFQSGLGLVLGGCVFLYLEFTRGGAPDIASLKTHQGILVEVPEKIHKAKGVELKTYRVNIETESEGVVSLLPDTGLVTTEKLAPFIGKPAVARVSSTGRIWSLELDGQPYITYEQVKKRYERKPSVVFPLGVAGLGLLLVLGGYFIPRSRL